MSLCGQASAFDGLIRFLLAQRQAIVAQPLRSLDPCSWPLSRRAYSRLDIGG